MGNKKDEIIATDSQACLHLIGKYLQGVNSEWSLHGPMVLSIDVSHEFVDNAYINGIDFDFRGNLLTSW